MFTLRKISSDGVQMNFIIGKNYTLILKEHNPKDFKELSKAFWNEETPENTYGFICGEGDSLPLFTGQFNYIMTSDGKTFSNLSHKP